MSCRLDLLADDDVAPPDLMAVGLQEVADAAVAEAGVGAATLAVRLIGDAVSGALHAAHFADPEPTDVMSFPDGGSDPEDGRLRLGDLAVNVALAAREGGKRRPGVPAARATAEECTLYIVHGLLHLLGYDDISPAKRKKMWARQRALLARIGIDLEAEPS
jgi:probable rRNA maturation factor